MIHLSIHLTHQIVAEFESSRSHDSVEKRGEFKFGANWPSTGTTLLLVARPRPRLLRVLFAFEAFKLAAVSATASAAATLDVDDKREKCRR